MIYQPVVILKPERLTLDDTARIDAFVKIEGGQGVVLGRGVHISSYVHLNIGGGRLIIRDNAAVASGARILTGTNTPAGRSMSSASPVDMQVIERGELIIEECAFVGAGATVLPQAQRIGRGAVIGAGAVVTRSVPDGEIWVGNPARRIGFRKEYTPAVDCDEAFFDELEGMIRL